MSLIKSGSKNDLRLSGSWQNT